MRFEGTLKAWNDERGFGFIEPVQGGQEIFVHIKSFPAGTGRPVVGLWLSFEIERGKDGKKRARAVKFAPQRAQRKIVRNEVPATWTVARLAVLPAFAALYYYLSTRWEFKPQVLLVYAVMSAVAFLAYAIDKSAAVHRRWRIKESTLLGLGLACGWPGALLAQQLFRHKTAKSSFVFAFWITVFLNAAALLAIQTGKLMPSLLG
jgi:uncharacterized membrane protein YsdA (DUF1294 family)/cold shock CspA family protein